MKNSIFSLLCIIALTAFSTNMAFGQSTAGTPIQGTEVGLDHDPGGLKIPPVTTDKAGKFSVKLEEGKYKMTVPYAQITKTLSGLNKNYVANHTAFTINLMVGGQSPDGNIFDRWGNLSKAPTNVIISRETGAISISVPKGGGAVSGTLTYTEVEKKHKEEPTLTSTLTASQGQNLCYGCPMIYIGVGSNNPGTKVKDEAYVTNTVGFNANVFVPIIKKKNFSFGFNGGGEYFSGSQDNFPPLPSPFHVVGETSSTVRGTVGSPITSGFTAGLAPQINFFVGDHFIISPMIELGYMSMTTKAYTVTQTTTIDGTDKEFILFSTKDTKTSGLAITPKVRLNYMFTKKIGMWVEGNYTVGPTVESSITILVPEPEPDKNGQYTIKQMQNGTTKTEMRETKFGSFGVHVGVVFGILDYPSPHDDPSF